MRVVPESQEFYRLIDQLSEPVILLDPELKFIWVNKEYSKHMRIPFEILLSMSIENIVPPEYAPILQKKFHEINISAVSFENIYPSVLTDGSILLENWHNEGVFDDNGELQYYFCHCTFEPVTEEAPLSESETETDLVSSTLINTSLIGIIVSVENRIIYINRRIWDIFGLPPEDFRTDPELDLLMNRLLHGKEQRILESINEGSTSSHEIMIRHPDGNDCWISIIKKQQLLHSKESDLFIIEDITDRKLIEIETAIAKDSLSNMARIAKLGYWEKDFYTNQWRWSDQAYDIYEIKKGTLITEEIIEARMDPESSQKRRESIESLLDTKKPAESYSFEYRILADESGEKWIAGEAFYVRELPGQAERLYGWVQDITARKQIEEDLRKAKEKAEESERLKTAFLANMSHEIRTPLNAILGFSDLLTKNPTDNERRKFNTIIHQSSKLLLKIIDDILDISTIESGALELDIENVSVNELFDNISDIFSDAADSKACFLIEKPENDILVKADKERLKQILLNLINNAIKYTIEGYITVSCFIETNNDCATFSVKDTGIGIKSEILDHIFDRFYQADSFSKGTGLGLAISRSIIEQMNGKISVKSVPGYGSTFSFTLPAA